MSEEIWAVQARPAVSPGATLLGQWEPAVSADLTAHRLQLAAALHGASRPAVAEKGAVERPLLAFEELVSNALRHGRHPVRVEVTTADGFWLLDVSDAAVDQPPTPAVGRDAAHRHGAVPHRQHLHRPRVVRRTRARLGCIDYTRVEARDTQLRSTLGPR